MDAERTHQRQRRSYWLKTLHQWHWISAAVCLVGLLLFTITGITLNHASQIEATPRVLTLNGVLPAELLLLLSQAAPANGDDATIPTPVRDWLTDEMTLPVGDRLAEWSEDEIYLSLPRPGGDAWLSIDLASGVIEYEKTDRGWIAWFNDLHKGRNTGGTWRWFIDIFAIASLVFCISGLFLLQMHARQRPTTWPMVGLGLLLPLLIALIFIH